MAITKLNDDLNIISALPNRPSALEYAPEDIKAKFDEGTNKIKTYINDTLIPQLQDEFTNASISGGTFKYMPCRVLIQKYTSPGEFKFDTSVNSSFTGLYDIVLIGAGGGGCHSTVEGGGGGGAVTTIIGEKLNGVYTVTVGREGRTVTELYPPSNGGTTTMVADSEDDYFYAYANGGAGADSFSKIAYGGGIGATDGTRGDGAGLYGAGGDSIGYGCGARGALLSEDARPAMGNGAGGWGTLAPTCGAVYIYGYVRQEV